MLIFAKHLVRNKMTFLRKKHLTNLISIEFQHIRLCLGKTIVIKLRFQGTLKFFQILTEKEKKICEIRFEFNIETLQKAI